MERELVELFRVLADRDRETLLEVARALALAQEASRPPRETLIP